MPDPLDIFAPRKNPRMNVALLLRLLADMMGDGEQPEEEGTKEPETPSFREPGIRTRPDWFPWTS